MQLVPPVLADPAAVRRDVTGDLAMSARARLAGLRPVRLDLPNATHRPPKPPRGSKHPALTMDTESS
ncbi:hypothetical protein ACFFMN_41710 [Planobispora siamensis]|uniref:Uncharacterized protein n=1 Tax=Planobispora siamensis TaxID=936338 RepID=A0A8J3WQL4_9ACTN|nr:hypothetical protein [Planobispora siamensis]GIH95911.1 hypothetical protein Psi01_65410 [Planobispora siamensis]